MRERNRWWIALMALAVMSGRGEDYNEQKVLAPAPGVLFGRPLSVDGNTAVTLWAEDWEHKSKEVVILERGQSGWKITQTFTNDYRYMWRQIELQGDEIFAQHEARIDIYRRVEGKWRKSDAIAFDYEPGYFSLRRFSVSGDRLALVGAYYREVPKIHLFRRVAGEWMKEGEIPAVDSETHFGMISLAGNRLLVSTAKIVLNRSQQRACIYELGGMTPRQMIEPPFEQEGAVFGGEVALGENWALINYHNATFTNGSGAIYAYRYNGEGWELKQEIRPESPMFDAFGSSMDLSGNKLLAGAPYRDERHKMAGAAFLFELVGDSESEVGRWVERKKFVASDGEHRGNVGAWVALSGETYVVSSEGLDNGAAYFIDEMIRLIPQRTAKGMRVIWPEKYRNARVEVQSSLGAEWQALELPVWSESEIRGVDVAPEGGTAFYRLVRE